LTLNKNRGSSITSAGSTLTMNPFFVFIAKEV